MTPSVEAAARQAFAHFTHGLSTGTWDPFLACLTDDVKMWFPLGKYRGLNEGKAHAAEFFAFVRASFPEGLTVELDRVMTDDTSCAFEFRDHGTLRGRPYENRVTVVFEMRDGQVCGYREYFGDVPPAPPAAPSYRALALQLECDAVFGLSADDARARIEQTLARIDVQLRGSLAFLGKDTQLVVLPEYVLTGYPMGEDADTWIAKACLSPDDATYESLGRIASKHGVHLAGNAYETDPHFPGLYFQTSFIVGPSGDVVLRYRRLQSLFAATPHDVWSKYLDIYGLEGTFPVADTALGRLAAVASEEILYPEITRCMALRGAEVIVHSSSEIHGTLATPKDIAKRARAYENMVYVVSSNTAGIEGTPIPSSSTDGGSKIINPRGQVMAEAGPGPSMAAHAVLDLGTLRRARSQPGMENVLSRQRLEPVVACMAEANMFPADTLLDAPMAPGHGFRVQRAVIQRLVEDGQLRRS